MLRPLAMAVVVILLGTSALHGQGHIVSDELDYAAFAAAVAPRLAELAAAWREGRKKLIEVPHPEGAAYRAEEVEVLLDEAETRVLATLEPPELAPMRDSIRLRFRRIRQQLGATAPVQSGRFAFASLRAARDGSFGLLLRRLVDPLLDAAGAVVQRVSTLAEERRFSLRLCVVSRPDAEAKFRMRSPGYPQGVKEGSTILFREVGRGHYAYLAEERKGKKRTIECGWEGGGDDRECLDLWETSGDQLYECDFARGDCTLHRLPGECPGS